MPLPREETTPPVTNTYLVMKLSVQPRSGEKLKTVIITRCSPQTARKNPRGRAERIRPAGARGTRATSEQEPRKGGPNLRAHCSRKHRGADSFAPSESVKRKRRAASETKRPDTKTGRLKEV